jgi:hypothetical protein
VPLQQQPLHRVILGVVVGGFVLGVAVTAALVDILAPQYENETWIRAAGGVGAAIVLAAFVIWLKVKVDREQQGRRPCPDCGTQPGELHALFCDVERCPFCGSQLSGCDCINAVLNLNEEERRTVAEYVDDSVEPLQTIVRRWADALDKKGRVPWVP